MKNRASVIALVVLGAIMVCLAGWAVNNALGQPEQQDQQGRTELLPPPSVTFAPRQPVQLPTAKSVTALPTPSDPDDGPDLGKNRGQKPPINTLPAPTSFTPSILPAHYAPQSKEGQETKTDQFSADLDTAAEGPGRTNENPTGRQEPAVSLEWIGPPTAKLGQPVTYQIIVKNVSSSPVHQVVVRNRVPAGITVQAADPKAATENKIMLWELGTLQPRQEKRIDLRLLPENKGDLACKAVVSFSGSSTANIRVSEPKLLVKATAPPKVLLGDMATVTLTVTNPGDGTADHVKIKTVLSDGLENPRGRTIDFDLGNLGPNESRNVSVVCNTKAGGPQNCDAVAVADGNLRSQDSANMEVILPRLDLAIQGPRLRYLERHATYVLKISNPGNAPASNVNVSDQIPDGFKYLNSSDGGRHDFASRTVSWFVGDLTPGQSREVSMEVVAVNTGEHKHKATVTAARGLKNDAEIITRVEGLSALLMELVDLDDPVEVGSETAYEIRVTNTGSKTETNLRLICTIPDKMEFRGAKGAADCKFQVKGKEVIFEVVPRLAPRADAIYRVKVRGIAPGDLRFLARITADGLTVPVHKEESTKVYGDDPIK